MNELMELLYEVGFHAVRTQFSEPSGPSISNWRIYITEPTTTPVAQRH